MKPSAMKSLLVKLLPQREPVLLLGSPGVGKTDVVSAATTELRMDLIVTHPVVDDPTDYKGLPAIVRGANGHPSTAEFLPLGDLPRMINATEPLVVFMDDLGQAPPAVQAAIMQLVLARKINGHRISDHVRFVAATNRRQDKAAVTGLITPLLDRFTTVVTMEFDLDDWIKWAIAHNMPPVLMAFARWKPDNVNKFEANKDMRKSPTPRSIAGIGRLLNQGIDDYEVLAGAAGEGFATEFLAFNRTYTELPSREEIYKNPEKVKVPADRLDVMYALMGSLAYGAKKENMAATVKYLSRCPAEFQVVCIRDAMERTPEITKTKAFTEWAVKNRAVFGYDS